MPLFFFRINARFFRRKPYFFRRNAHFFRKNPYFFRRNNDFFRINPKKCILTFKTTVFQAILYGYFTVHTSKGTFISSDLLRRNAYIFGFMQKKWGISSDFLRRNKHFFRRNAHFFRKNPHFFGFPPLKYSIYTTTTAYACVRTRKKSLFMLKADKGIQHTFAGKTKRITHQEYCQQPYASSRPQPWRTPASSLSKYDQESSTPCTGPPRSTAAASHTYDGSNAQFKQKQWKVKMREMNCKWLRMSNIS